MPFTESAWQQGKGSPAIFTHANGFPPLCYAPLLEQLATRFHITALANRALTQCTNPDSTLSWRHLAKDVNEWLDINASEPVTGIGHSMGAATLIYAAAQKPEKFRSLVLIEPAMTGPLRSCFKRLLPRSILKNLEPAKSALNRRDYWESKEHFITSCQRSGLYDRFLATNMENLVSASIKLVNDGYQLVFPKLWEAHFFMQTPCPFAELAQLKMPVVAIRATESVFLNKKLWNRIKSKQADGLYTEVDNSGHLLPLENPEAVAEIIFNCHQTL